MISDFHQPVLVNAVNKLLITKQDGTYVDGTLGGGGHAESILLNTTDRGTLIGLDVDNEALNFAKKRLTKFQGRVIFCNDNFANIKQVLEKLSIKRIDGLLLDLGVSSYQIDSIHRGFSYQREEKLDMRMNQNLENNARDVINNYSSDKLYDIFKTYGEEKYSRKIVSKIIEMRKKRDINTTLDLKNIIESVVGKKSLIKSLARIFQAIRIEVNREIDSLKKVLMDTVDIINPGGRIVVISYHSIEDRIVKNFFHDQSVSSIPSESKLVPHKEIVPKLKVITKKPLQASEDEISRNKRARSAKLRAAERL
jgi:16S rRNA (cytosine1402-N4)-methyltransferase